MKTLNVEITEVTDETQWAWRLLTSEGSFLSDHQVHLDARAGEFEGFVNLPQYVGWNSENGNDPAVERELVNRVARWVGTEVWGPMAESILAVAEEAPVTVLIKVPPEAEFLLYRPFELPFALGGATPGADITLIYDVVTDESGGGGAKQPVESALRILALFSAPADQVALNTRFERDQLRRLVEQVTTMGRAVELRILQYGVTRAQLEDILEDGEGWDLVHFSGHGIPHGLVLETEEGNADLIPSAEFAELLRPTRARLKLVTLSSCESGAVAAAQALEALGIPTEDSAEASDRDSDSDGLLPAAARNLTRDLRCAVVAMRYAVADEFAAKLTTDLYEGLLIHRQTVARALQRAIKKAAADQAGLSIATPALFGTSARDLLLVPPDGTPPRFDLAASKVAYFDPEPEHFVGRVRQLSRANSALAPKSEKRAIVFCGMAGAGKTACALELAYAHEDRRFEAMAWHRAPNDGDDIGEALAQFIKSLELQLDGFALAEVIDDVVRLKESLPRFERLLAERSILIVLDNAESLLAADGSWRDERWGMMVEALVSHSGRSRFVITSRLVPAGLDRASVLVETIDTLSANEAALLASQMPNLGRLMSLPAEAGQPNGRALVRRALEIVQGHPKLIEMAEAAAADLPLLEERLAEAGTTWTKDADLNAFFRTGEADEALGGEAFLTVLETWTLGLTRNLPAGPRFVFQLLCCVQREDRLMGLLSVALPIVREMAEGEDTPADFLREATETLAAHGLVDIEHLGEDAFYRIHPALEQAERGEIDADFSHEVDTAMGALWMSVFEASQRKGDLKVAVRAGISVAPYLLRLEDVNGMIWVLGLVISQDPSPQKLAIALSLFRRALELADSPKLERRLRREVLKCRFGLGVRTPDTIAELKELMELSKAAGDIFEIEIMRGTLFNELFRRNSFEEALKLLDPAEDPEIFAQLSETQKIIDDVHRFQLMQALGENRRLLEETEPLLQRVAEHEPAEQETVFDALNLREVILSFARMAAKSLEEWDKSLEFNAAIREIEISQNASELMRAKTDFNDHSALIELGRLPEAEAILRRVRRVAEGAEDLQLLGYVFDAWAVIEKRRGRPDQAIAFARKSLRSAYRFGLPQSINVAHHNMANYLEAFRGDNQDIAAHRLAEVLASLQTGSGEYPEDAHTLALTILRIGSEALPASFEELCDRLRESWEIDYKRFFDELPQTVAGGQEALAFALGDAYGLIELGLTQPSDPGPG